MPGLGRSWKIHVAIPLLLPIWWWLGLPPLWSPVDLAEHYAAEGEHCDEICSYPVSLIDPPQASPCSAIVHDDPEPCVPLLAWLPDDQARKPPSADFLATSHSLRAPPSLIVA
ncbi:MAG: hypothetical protein KAX87_08630 [Nitrospira sp.]|nr:hypothetical protein [Nitrospira sp.]